MRSGSWISVASVALTFACSESGAAHASKNLRTASVVGAGSVRATASGSPGAVASDAPGCGVCKSYGSTSVAGTVPSVLSELSGLAASRSHPGVLYTHNDSGDSARFFAISATAESLGEFRVENASAVDWEDIAVGPCPAGSCVFLGDIGDNSARRSEYVVYRVTEPDVAVGRSVGTVTVGAQRFPFVYPDGSHDAETLLANPNNGDLYVVTKVPNRASTVYRFPTPLTAGTRATLVLVGPVGLAGSEGVVTGGDLHPCETRLLVRTYEALWEFTIGPAEPYESVFAATPVRVPVAIEPQGEAVTYRSNGRGYFTASEGSDVPLHAVGCR